MANKRKLATAAVAVTAAAAMLLSGTFAWQSISQTALNEASDVINPGGRLHDDFNGENKDIYVENFADEQIFARVRLSEYMEFVMNYGVEGLENREIVLGSKDEDGTYNYELFNSYDSLENGVVSAGNYEGISYWNWTTGGSTVYMPTFNLNKDSLAADVNGIYEDGNIGTISDRILDMTDENAQYSAYTEYNEGDTKIGNEVYDADANDVEDEHVTEVEATHTAKPTGNASLMSMQQWIDEGMNLGEYWVYDTDGWVYWAQAIEPDTATGLLLDGIELSEVMDDTWYYAIHVEAQFVTADDVGKSDGTGFYVDGTEPTPEAEDLLRTIGVTSVDDEPGEAPGESGGDDWEDEPYTPFNIINNSSENQWDDTIYMNADDFASDGTGSGLQLMTYIGETGHNGYAADVEWTLAALDDNAYTASENEEETSVYTIKTEKTVDQISTGDTFKFRVTATDVPNYGDYSFSTDFTVIIGEAPVEDDTTTTTNYALTVGDGIALIGSNDTTGLVVSLTADGEAVTDGVEWVVSNENAVVSEGSVKASATAQMTGALEKYTVTANIDGTAVAQTDVYMYDSARHAMYGLDTYAITSEKTGSTYCIFTAAQQTYIEMETVTGCVWKYGDSVGNIYQYTHQIHATLEQLVESYIEPIIYQGSEQTDNFTYTTCPHLSTESNNT